MKKFGRKGVIIDSSHILLQGQLLRMGFPNLMQTVSQVIDFRLRELHGMSALQGISDSR